MKIPKYTETYVPTTSCFLKDAENLTTQAYGCVKGKCLTQVFSGTYAKVQVFEPLIAFLWFLV